MAHRPLCFDAAMEVSSELEDFGVVHAWIRKDSMWVLHAWAENEDAVYDLTETNSPIRREDYYAACGVTEERLRRYDRVAFFTQVAEKGMFGPFDTGLFFATESEKDPLEVMKTFTPL
ncbi:hypothetical protein [Oleidesulfovibrio sp.]|uniref:hypothetical protein n=1 Tax=Oleidesulfovibrio sp. TaxID=2909707 RepID=UPI003A8A0D36